ncbi:hypothetical protein [Halodesulfurarchaeum sp.]|uniref:hypothetical protein n=1 Tax=Halodesulfurarchaeum sp. TaxID=1980530 RepID=UPI001BB881D3|nr:hypothetical protein [Halodesulfurarchaeum sp.]
MASAVKLSVRTGIVGSWAVLFGGTLVLGLNWVLGLISANGSNSVPLAAAGFPIVALAETALINVYNGSAFTVLIGVLLVTAGWYQLLRLSATDPV